MKPSVLENLKVNCTQYTNYSNRRALMGNSNVLNAPNFIYTCKTQTNKQSNAKKKKKIRI